MQPYLWSEPAAFAKLEEIVWPRGPTCPHCGALDRIGAVTGKSARIGLKFCCRCRKQFRATLGTMFEGSHVPLHKWFQACFLLMASRRAIGAHRLHLRLEVSNRTAASMLRRLELALGGLAHAGFGAGLAPADTCWTERSGLARTRRHGGSRAHSAFPGENTGAADVFGRGHMPWTHSSVMVSEPGFPQPSARQFLGFVEAAQAFNYPDNLSGFDAVLTAVGCRRVAAVTGQ